MLYAYQIWWEESMITVQYRGGVKGQKVTNRGAGKARFNVATLTYETVTCTAYVLLYNLQTKSN